MGLTAGPHLPVTARKKEKGVRCWAGGREENGLARPAARGGRRPAAWESTRAERKRKKKGVGPA
jgi:hypothetical protein